MTGFYSKDFILESAFGQYQFSSIAVYLIATIGAIFTTLYSVKVLYLTFLSPVRYYLLKLIIIMFRYFIQFYAHCYGISFKGKVSLLSVGLLGLMGWVV